MGTLADITPNISWRVREQFRGLGAFPKGNSVVYMLPGIFWSNLHLENHLTCSRIAQNELQPKLVLTYPQCTGSQPPQLGTCELVLYTHTPVTACDQVLPMPRSDLTNQRTLWREPDQSEAVDSSSLYSGPVWSRLAPDSIGNINI